MIVGLSGKKQAGKDTAGVFIKETYGYDRASFAGLLKRSVSELLDVPLPIIETWKNQPEIFVQVVRKDWGTTRLCREYTFRQFLQRYGTEAHRDVFGRDFWVDAVRANLLPGRDYVFTDARFDNECRAIKEMGGVVIYLERGDDDGDGHESETPPSEDLIDYRIANDGTVDDLYDNLRGILLAERVVA